ncbi:hypothetical protein SAMN05421493_104150 [Pseudobutyrivibrio sp. 49]|nr:hypothetical protein [Pseudobutyrivibrio sp. 49]SDH83327.1 hypothetical protein SAMN05421493_104150 [Pseudobutyrivibrio sp. 49]
MFGIDWNLDGDVDIIDDMITLDLIINDEEVSEKDESDNSDE